MQRREPPDELRRVQHPELRRRHDVQLPVGELPRGAGVFPATTIPSCAGGRRRGRPRGRGALRPHPGPQKLSDLRRGQPREQAEPGHLRHPGVRPGHLQPAEVRRPQRLLRRRERERSVPIPGNTAWTTAIIQADDGDAIEAALRRIFENILRRATSGTAASVLASGEGSGANLVQAVFYPRRRFFDEVIEWTGTLQNLWYYVDPFLGNSSIREDSDKSADSTYIPMLNLFTDNTVEFFFDQASRLTKANEYANNSTTGNKTGTPAVVPFEEVQSIWEAGTFLHSGTASSRTIFTVDRQQRGSPDETALHRQQRLHAAELSDAASDAEATAIIQYVRGTDDVNGDGVIDYRQRTVPFPANTAADNTVWKLGDIINSTPKIASRVPLNTYDKKYGDTTYKEYTGPPATWTAGWCSSAPTTGCCTPSSWGSWSSPGTTRGAVPGAMDKARLRNLDASVPLGQERWAFIPKNALPYLKAMLDNNYCHLYYVDQPSQLFDASIGPPTGFVADNADADRLELADDPDRRDAVRGRVRATAPAARHRRVDLPWPGHRLLLLLRASTSPTRKVPSVLWEFSDPAARFRDHGPGDRPDQRRGPDEEREMVRGLRVRPDRADLRPAVPGKIRPDAETVRRRPQDRGAASGRSNRGTAPSAAIGNAFAGSMVNATADFNLDYQDDALYFGYVRESPRGLEPGGGAAAPDEGRPEPEQLDGRHGDRRRRPGHLLHRPAAEQHLPHELAVLRERQVLLRHPVAPRRRVNASGNCTG